MERAFRFEGLHTPSLIDWDGSDDFPEFQKLVEDITAIIGKPARERRKPQTSRMRRHAAPQPPIKVDSREPGTIFQDTLKDGSSGPEMIVIPAGTFHMGDTHGIGTDFEKPVHAVHFPTAFALERYQVTFDEYDKFAKVTRRALPEDHGWGRGRRPVINVSWEDARDYAEWLLGQTGGRYRLPTEAEWEYAAKIGGENEIWAGTSHSKDLAGYSVFSKGQTEPVGSRKPNGIGLHDMSGNVWEWVEDCWHENYDGAPKDGSAWLEAGIATRVCYGAVPGAAFRRTCVRLTGAGASLTSATAALAFVLPVTLSNPLPFIF